MDKDTLAMMKQILKDEESLDQLRDKLDCERNLNFSKERPHKPEPEKVFKDLCSGKIAIKTGLCKVEQAVGCHRDCFCGRDAFYPRSRFWQYLWALLIFVDIFLMIAAAGFIFFISGSLFSRKR